MATKIQTQTLNRKPRRKRPGVHSKKRASKIKRSKNYKKLYKGQGK
jgi:hypothetical protein